VGVLLDQFGTGDAREREESWRYSRNALRALEQLEFAPAASSASLPDDLIERFDWAETRSARLVFVNGAYSQQHSNLMGTAFHVEHHDARSSIRIHGAGRLHLVFASVPGAAPVRWRREIDIEAAHGAELIEHHVGGIGVDVLGSVNCRLAVAADVGLTLLTDLPDSVSLYRREQASIARTATLRSTAALFGGRLQRFDLGVDLADSGARYVARGVFALSSRQHADVHLDVRHLARDTMSDVLWRGVADARARGILRGAISVAAGADGADARLQTKNLLLSPHAEIDAQPVLEIHADDVKASHGATVGQLDELALFYLRSRGIAADDARALLIGGFCREAFAGLPDVDLFTRLDAALAQRLPDARATPP
jgi:Fe-S cluster assembly protein SufD